MRVQLYPDTVTARLYCVLRNRAVRTPTITERMIFGRSTVLYPNVFSHGHACPPEPLIKRRSKGSRIHGHVSWLVHSHVKCRPRSDILCEIHCEIMITDSYKWYHKVNVMTR